MNRHPLEEKFSVENIEVSVRQKHPVNGIYTEFTLRVGDAETAFNGCQLAYTDPSKIYCTDLTGDNKKDIIVVFQSSSGEEYFYINNEYYEYRISGDTLRLLFSCGIWKYGVCGYLDVSFKLEETEFVFDTAEFIQ